MFRFVKRKFQKILLNSHKPCNIIGISKVEEGRLPYTFQRMCLERREHTMMISTKGRYALRVLIDMAEHQTDGYIPLKEIAKRQDISEKYLESIVKSLVKGGVVEGMRGKGGGYRLCKSPDQFTTGQILRLMEGSLAPVACLEAGSSPCDRAGECRTLSLWAGLNDVINKYLDQYTLADLLREDGDYDYVI